MGSDGSGNKTFDILGIGTVTVDDVMSVDEYPEPETKVNILEEYRQCGGLVATALVAASRLGSRCAYSAILGHDGLSSFVLDALRREGIETSYVRFRSEARPIHSRIIVDVKHSTRTIIFNRNNVVWLDPSTADPGLMRSARILFLDHYTLQTLAPAVEEAAAAGIEVVADVERGEPPEVFETMRNVDHLILSSGYARRITGTGTARDAVQALWSERRKVVVVTEGIRGSWYRHGESASPEHLPAFEVNTADTTGCGDVFHGAYASALARGFPVADRIRLATGAAALRAEHWGAQSGIPTAGELDAFLKARGYPVEPDLP